MQILAILIAIVIPLIVLLVIRALDLYGTGSFTTLLWCIGFGGLMFGAAYVLNTLVFDLTGWDDWLLAARFIAPPVEEILKALFLIFLVRRANFTYFVDGAIYGFAVGIGFAVFENVQYILAAGADAGFGAAIGRVVSTNLIHGCATALTGISLGLARFQKPPMAVLSVLGGLGIAIGLHGAFNNLVALVVDGPVLLYATVIAMLAMALIAALIFRGLAQSRRWIEENLGVGDRVTQGEAKVVRRLQDVHELLEPLRKMFGEAKGAQIEQLLMVQARLGIQRGAYDKLPDEGMRRSTQVKIDELTAEMETLRRSIGAYTMLAVRQIVPEENSPLWDVLKNRIQEKIDARPATGGMNLFSSLGQRMSSAPKPAEPSAPHQSSE